MSSTVPSRSWRALLVTSEVIFASVAAVLAAPVLFIAGLGMTMSIVLLPFGLASLLAGVLLLVWGLFGHTVTH